MKKFYLLSFVAFTISLISSAQIIEDDFEFYTLGDMGLQNPMVWTTWTGVPDDGTNIQVTGGIFHSGTQAGYIGPGGSQDVLLSLGNMTTGEFNLSFYMYIPTSNTGYFNIQGETEDPGTGYQGAGNGGSGVFNSSNLYFNEAGTNPGLFVDQTTGETATYPEDEFFWVEIYFDVDNFTYEITIDGTLVHSNPVPFQADFTLGAINFFSIDVDNNYWIDDVVYQEPAIVNIDDFAANNFKVYPNPVQDILNFETKNAVDAIVVYDVLGKLVLSTTPDTISPKVDMSTLTSGAYLMKVTINGTSKTVKVIK